MNPKLLFKPLRGLVALGLALSCLAGTPAEADPIGTTAVGFDAPVPLSDTSGPNAWSPDRYRPAAFESFDFNGRKVLRLAIAGVEDGAEGRGSRGGVYYNTQGRKIELPPRSYSVEADFYYPASWEGDVRRRSELWGTALNSVGGISYYPIIGVANTDGTPVIRCYNGTTGDWVISAIDLVPGTWYRFGFRLAGGNMEYLVDGVVIAALPTATSVSIKDAMFQAYNFNDPTLGPLQSADDYEVYWDNFSYSYPVIHNTTQDTFHFTLAEAIAEADAGSVIELPAGAYTGEYTVDKALTIRGAKHGVQAGPNPGARGTGESIIDGGIYVSASNVVIDGLTIRNGRAFAPVKAGIAVAAHGVTVTNTIIEDVLSPNQSDGLTTTTGVNNLTLTNSTIRNNWRGVYLNPGSGHVFTNNLITGNNGVGVGIGSDGQSNLTLTGNTISDHILEGWGASGVGANVIASENSFINNEVSVAHHGGNAIDANYNYWGSAAGPAGEISLNVTALTYCPASDGMSELTR